MDLPMQASTVYDFRAGLAISARRHRSQLNLQSQEKNSSISLPAMELAQCVKFDVAFFSPNFIVRPL